MKYKYLRLRLIIPSLIVILLALIVLLFFVGGLEAATVKRENIEFTTEGFLEPKVEIIGNNRIWKLGDNELNKKKFVAENDKYVMYIDEDSTIVSVYDKANWDLVNGPKGKPVFTTANPDSTDNDEKSNITLYYYDQNGKLSNGLSSYDKSINYENKLAGTYEKHYQIRYNDDGSIDILYQIGDFSNLLETIPKYFNRMEFEDLFVGNTYFNYSAENSSIQQITVVDESGNTINASEIKLNSKFTNPSLAERDTAYGYGICFDNEAAKYILENNLGIIEYTSEKDNTRYTEMPDDENEILSKESGYWKLYNIVNEEGKLKLEIGVHYNTNESPVKVNPFLNASYINTITDSYYPINYDITDENGDKQITTIRITDRVNLDNSYLELKAIQSLSSQDLYKYLVVGQASLVETTQTLPQYLISDESKPNYIKIYLPQQRIIDSTKSPVYFDYNGDGVITSDEKYIYGGTQARDPQNNYLFIDENNYIFYFDKDGNRMLNDDEGNPVPVESTSSFKPYQTGLTHDISREQNEAFGTLAEAESKAFQLCLRVKLTDDGLSTVVLNNSIIEGLGKDNTDPNVLSYFKHNNDLAKVEICKYLTANNKSKNGNNNDGMIVIPDGSGAVINFNSVKDSQYVGKYVEKPIYGVDRSINMEQKSNFSYDILLPMFGILDTTDGYGIVAIVDKGAGQSTITANFKRASTQSGIDKYNHAYFTTYFRNNENVRITATSSYNKVSPQMYTSDIAYDYKFVKATEYEKFDYTTVAKVYREYLVNKYELTEKDTTKEANPTICFIGAYTKKTIVLGMVRDAERSLTSFEQAGEIVDDLRNNGINTMNVGYTLWEDQDNNSISADYKVSKALGGKSDLIEFNEKLKNYSYSLYLDKSVLYGMGYDFPFGSLKYNAKSIAGAQSSQLEYVISTGLADTTRGGMGRLSPVFYNSLVGKLLKNMESLDVSGLYLGLGSSKNSDYASGRVTYSADADLLVMEALQTVKDNGKLVEIYMPYDYTFKYVDSAGNVPVETTLLPIVDYSIPLYQLVCSGLFDYTATIVNDMNDNTVEWNILKAIETGSNLYFYISANDTSELLDTNYIWAYNTYYANWKEKIIYMNKVLNNVGIYQSKLVDHEIISDTLVRVRYENGLQVLINYSNTNYVDSSKGISVRANWFAIES